MIKPAKVHATVRQKRLYSHSRLSNDGANFYSIFGFYFDPRSIFVPVEKASSFYVRSFCVCLMSYANIVRCRYSKYQNYEGPRVDVSALTFSFVEAKKKKDAQCRSFWKTRRLAQTAAVERLFVWEKSKEDAGGYQNNNSNVRSRNGSMIECPSHSVALSWLSVSGGAETRRRNNELLSDNGNNARLCLAFLTFLHPREQKRQRMFSASKLRTNVVRFCSCSLRHSVAFT